MKNGLKLTKIVVDEPNHVSVRYQLDFYEDGELWKTDNAYLVSTNKPEEMETLRNDKINPLHKAEKYNYATKEEFLKAGWFDELKQKGIKAF